MNKIVLKAENRKTTRRKVKVLRRQGILPANIFGKNIKSQSVQVKITDFRKTFKEAGETNVVTLDVDGDEKPVLIHNVQSAPVTSAPIHVDFLQINLKEKVLVKVPLVVVGESPAEKQGAGIVVQYIDEIEVEALPNDLPDKIEVDSAKLTDVDQSVFVKDLDIDTKKLEVKTDGDTILVKVEPPTKEEEIIQPKTEEAVEEGTAEASKEGTQESAVEEPSKE